MASYTDKMLPFNPYIQQLPVEAMVKVGMEKQRRYDQGIQKIQTQIDNVAGLDIVRDVDKQYLQSSLSQLGDNLKTVAAGDFSNYQLVNSTGGMVAQLGRDVNIQNAVSSTARYKKETNNLEAVRKAGKSSVQNEWDYDNKSAEYLNSTDLKKSFNTRYQQFIDIDKKWLDVYKNLHSDLKEADIPYERNPDGAINREKTAAAMARMSKESVSAAQIENALRASLSPDEQNQLSINGRYQFKDITPEALISHTVKKYQSQIALNDATIQDLQGLANLSTSNPAERAKALRIIEETKENTLTLKDQLASETNLIQTNPEAAKTEIYKDGAIRQFAAAHAWEHNKNNVLANPVQAQQNWEVDAALRKSNFNLGVTKQKWAEYKDKHDMDLGDKKHELALKKQNVLLYGAAAPPETYLGQSTAVSNPRAAMTEDELELRDNEKKTIAEMASKIGASPVQIQEAIEKYNSADPNASNSALKIPVEWRDTVEQLIKNRGKADRIGTIVSKTVAEVENSEVFKAKKAATLDKVKELGNISLTLSNGTTLVYTPNEVAALVGKRTYGGYDVKGGLNLIPTITFNNNSLSDKEKQFINYPGVLHSSIFRQYQETISSDFQNIQTEIDKEVDKKLLEKSGTYIPRVVGVSLPTTGGSIARRTWETNVTNALMKYDSDLNGLKGADAKMSLAEAEKVRGWMNSTNKDDLQYKVLTQGEKTYVIVLNGNDEVTVPFNSKEANQLPLQDPNAPSDEYKDIVLAQTAGDGKTNPTGDFNKAYFIKSDMPQVTFDVKADLTANASNPGKQYVTFQISSPLGPLSLQLETPLNKDQALNYIHTMTNEKIKQLYLNSPVIPDAWKEIIKTYK